MNRTLFAGFCLALGLAVAWPQQPHAQSPKPEQQAFPQREQQHFVRGLRVPDGQPKGTLVPTPIDPARPWGWMLKASLEHPDQPLYNRAKARLLEGKTVYSHVITHLDVEQYCRQAPHYDYTWFEMQHSLMTFADVQKMLQACPHAGAAPMIRLPDAFESTMQKALDIGALGVVIPTVDDGPEARDAAMWARFPPAARRSSGNTTSGPGAKLWNPVVPPGSNFRQSFNDNMLLVVMIETMEGVNNAFEIASTPGVDVVIIGSNDLQEFTGIPMSDNRYQDLLTRVRDATYLAGKFFGNVIGKDNPLRADARFFEYGPTMDGYVDPKPRHDAE
jgi:2-keto-3-deoxy-L-rhamnonate aldolase RhmA